MNPQQQQPKLNIDLKNTKSIETPEGNKIFQQGVLLRSVSKFVVGAEEDAVLPVDRKSTRLNSSHGYISYAVFCLKKKKKKKNNNLNTEHYFTHNY